jgi:hypothetical protein
VKFLNDIITIFIILFVSILALGAMIVLFKVVFVTISNLIATILVVFIVSFVYACGRYINRNFK